MANQIFKDQDLLLIELDTGYNGLATATEIKILFQKPDETKGFWTATHVPATNKIKYDVQEGDLDQEGPWSIQAYFKVSGREAFGTIVKFNIKANLKS